MTDIGKRIRIKREELGITQEELAKLLGYKNKSTIAKIENGTNDITQSKVVDFAHVLHTTVAYLMGWADESATADNLMAAYESSIHSNDQLNRIIKYYKEMNQPDREMLENMAKRFAEAASKDGN